MFKPPFTLAGRGGFFIVSNTYTFPKQFPQSFFNPAETISVHSTSYLVLLLSRAIMPNGGGNMTSKSELISAAIMRHLISGIEAEKTIDSVLGEGTVKQLTSEIYEVYEEQSAPQKAGNE
jgi:hypothetical protein